MNLPMEDTARITDWIYFSPLLGIEDLKAIMGFPDKFEIYLHKDGDTLEGDFKDYHYWLNKARYTIAKGSVYEVGIWFKKCLKKANI